MAKFTDKIKGPTSGARRRVPPASELSPADQARLLATPEAAYANLRDFKDQIQGNNNPARSGAAPNRTPGAR